MVVVLPTREGVLFTRVVVLFTRVVVLFTRLVVLFTRVVVLFTRVEFAILFPPPSPRSALQLWRGRFVRLVQTPHKSTFYDLTGECLIKGYNPPIISRAVGASSQCYWEELMLLKCEIMLLKCKINTNTYKNGFLLPTKCLEGVLKYSY